MLDMLHYMMVQIVGLHWLFAPGAQPALNRIGFWCIQSIPLIALLSAPRGAEDKERGALSIMLHGAAARTGDQSRAMANAKEFFLDLCLGTTCTIEPLWSLVTMVAHEVQKLYSLRI